MTRILLVEDDPDVSRLLQHVLLNAGYHVDAAQTVAAARSSLHNGSHDLVLADAVLPDGDGLDVADEAQRRGIRTLVISGYGFRLPADRLRRHEFVIKPIRPSELISAVKLMLGERP